MATLSAHLRLCQRPLLAWVGPTDLQNVSQPFPKSEGSFGRTREHAPHVKD